MISARFTDYYYPRNGQSNLCHKLYTNLYNVYFKLVYVGIFYRKQRVP